MLTRSPLTRTQISDLAKDAVLRDGYRDPIVQGSPRDISDRKSAYANKWRVSLIVTDEKGNRWHGSTEVIYINLQSYFAEPKIKIGRPAPQS